MNTHILDNEIQDFIAKNVSSDTTKLALKGSPFKNVSSIELVNQIVSKNKCKLKLPTWYTTPKIYYPNKLNIEQSSSEITAKFKQQIVSGKSLIDVTGGFGVDSFYFSKIFNTIFHCEQDKELSAIVTHNFNVLGVQNCSFINENSIDFLKKTSEHFDWIFIDPSRRDKHKSKVFLLEDCAPNIIEHLPILFQKANSILVKLSPLLDISLAIQQLKNIKNIYIVALENEVKELLLELHKEYNSTITIKTINFSKSTIEKFDFPLITSPTIKYTEPQDFLYEPNAAIMKSGGFKEVAAYYNLSKLHVNSHLYTNNNLIEFPGRRFKIINSLNFDKKLLKANFKNKKANITTRNFHLNPVQLKKQFGIKDGGDDYLFFTKNIQDKHIVLICRKC